MHNCVLQFTCCSVGLPTSRPIASLCTLTDTDTCTDTGRVDTDMETGTGNDTAIDTGSCTDTDQAGKGSLIMAGQVTI